MSILARACSLSLAFTAACTVGTLGGPDPDPGSGTDPGSNTDPTAGTIQGAITQDATWSGKVTIAASATILAGVTVTVAPGTVIEGKAGATLHVAGKLDVAGTKASAVNILPATGTPTWPGLVADAGGNISLTWVTGASAATLVYCHTGATCALNHVEFSQMGNAIVVEGTATINASRLTEVANGGITITGGDLEIVDTYVLTSQGDIIVQNGGNLDIQYSEVGDAQGTYEHCDFHINSAAKLSITHSNIRNGVYGMMIGGTTNAIITSNNFLKNGTGTDLDAIGTNTNADFTGSYFDQGKPTMVGGNFAAIAPAQLADAGPRAANI
jgi:hypothetical protein